MSEKEKQKISMDEFEQITREAEKNYSISLSKHIKKIVFVIILFCIYAYIPKTIFITPTSHTNEVLDTSKEPVMIINNDNLKALSLSKRSDYEKLIKYKSLKNRKTYYLMPLAEYSITAKVLEKNTFFYLKWDFDNVSLVDLGFAWGDMAKDEYFNKLYGHSNQDVTGRRLIFSFKDKYRDSLNDKFNYMADHTSHTHTIPANKKINKVLHALRKGQTVKLEGYLVDIYNSDFFRFGITSLSLTDVGYDNGRDGGGACEVMYVTKVQIGDIVYE